MNDISKYSDIINLPHHVSERHPQLSRDSYAAQFSPFAALSGYDRIVSETARITDEKKELGESEMNTLSTKLRFLADYSAAQPEATYTYFKADTRKLGGAYLQKTAQIKRLDSVNRVIYFTDGTNLLIDDVTDIQGEIFNFPENDFYSD